MLQYAGIIDEVRYEAGVFACRSETKLVESLRLVTDLCATRFNEAEFRLLEVKFSPSVIAEGHNATCNLYGFGIIGTELCCSNVVRKMQP